MALAEDPPVDDWAPDEAPTPADRQRILQRFLDDHFVPAADPDDDSIRVDAYDLAQAFTAWLAENRLPHTGRTTLYSDLRLAGYTVKRSSGNRQFILGIAPAPLQQSTLNRLLATAQSPEFAAQRLLPTLARDVQIRARDLADRALERLVPLTFTELEEFLSSSDPSDRRWAIDMVWSRTIPKIRVREIEDQPVNAAVIEGRATVSEIVEILKKKGFDPQSKAKPAVEYPPDG